MSVQSTQAHNIGKIIEELTEEIVLGCDDAHTSKIEQEIDGLQEEYFQLEGQYYRSMFN